MSERDPRHFAVRGTPTDCVLMGVKMFIGDARHPIWCCRAFNRGANMGEDVTYSGTVAVAMEGTLLGIRSMALSQHVSGPGRMPLGRWPKHTPQTSFAVPARRPGAATC